MSDIIIKFTKGDDVVKACKSVGFKIDRFTFWRDEVRRILSRDGELYVCMWSSTDANWERSVNKLPKNVDICCVNRLSELVEEGFKMEDDDDDWDF